MKITKITTTNESNNRKHSIPQSMEHSWNSCLVLGIEIVTIFVILKFAMIINSQPSNVLPDETNTRKYYFIVLFLGIIIIHNLIIGGWHTPKDFIFIAALIVIGIWVWRNNIILTTQDSFFGGKYKNTTTTTKPSITTSTQPNITKQKRIYKSTIPSQPAEPQHEIQELGYEDIDYNLPEAGRNNKQQIAELVGTDLVDAHPEVDSNELVWGNKPEHYDFVPDDIPGYLDLPALRKLKRLQNKVKKDKNYKYLAEIKPYDPQAMHRSDGDPGSELMLHRKHGLDNLFLQNANQHKAYGMPKEVLNALSNSPYGVWKEGKQKSADVNGRDKYIRKNGVGESWYKFLKEPEPTLTPDTAVVCNGPATTTTRPDGLKTSPDNGTGPVMQTTEIRDEMIEANRKFRATEYFTNPRTTSTVSNYRQLPINDVMPQLRMDSDNNKYSLYSDAINQKLPGSSDKILEYATNYPLVSLDSLSKINDNCARRLDGSCPKY